MSASVKVHGIVGAPIEETWELFRKFGAEIMAWWPIYEWVKLDAPGEDTVGCVRSFKSDTGREYKEKLEVRDDQNHVMKYSLVEVKPSVPSLKTIMTTIEMTPSGEDTLVQWSSETDISGIFAGQVTAVQEKTYSQAIKYLDLHFNPSLGDLNVHLIKAKGLSGDGLFPHSAFAIARLDDGKPATSKSVFPSSHPSWNETLNLNVLSKEGKLELAVWSNHHLDHDTFLGSAQVDIHTLKNGQRSILKLDLEGVDGGEITVALTLNLKGDEEELGLTKATEDAQQAEHLMHIVQSLASEVTGMFQQLNNGEPERYEYDRYPRAPLLPEVDLENLPRMAKGIPPKQLIQPEKLGKIVQRSTEYAYSQMEFVKRLSDPSADKWQAFFADWVHCQKHLVEKWKDDTELCRQLLTGVNPMDITQCTKETKIPHELRELKGQGKSVNELIEERRLFILDYDLLVDIPLYRDMVFYAPVALVYRELLDNGRSRLNIMGIMLTRDEQRNEVYTPNSDTPNKWLLAKLHLTCADNQYHQFIHHLGMTHLGMESFAVASHNNFPKEHIIGDLLRPHFHDTIGLNYLARRTLVSPVIPFTDRTFSPGTAGALKLFLSAWKNYDFEKYSFPNQLLERGFDEEGTDNVEDYYYRDDGFKIWNALTGYVQGVVDATYPDDAAVLKDAPVQSWAEECADVKRAAVPGFPARIESKEKLVSTLTNIIFNCSAQHSAVNFSQYEYVGYVPNRPDSLFKPMPKTPGDIEASYIDDALPNMVIGQFQVLFAYLLTTPSENPLTTLDVMKDRLPKVHSEFHRALKTISEEIIARNTALLEKGEAPYPYLMPDRVASSIDI